MRAACAAARSACGAGIDDHQLVTLRLRGLDGPLETPRSLSRHIRRSITAPVHDFRGRSLGVDVDQQGLEPAVIPFHGEVHLPSLSYQLLPWSSTRQP
jgi:hypothetical protein